MEVLAGLEEQPQCSDRCRAASGGFSGLEGKVGSKASTGAAIKGAEQWAAVGMSWHDAPRRKEGTGA